MMHSIKVIYVIIELSVLIGVANCTQDLIYAETSWFISFPKEFGQFCKL